MRLLLIAACLAIFASVSGGAESQPSCWVRSQVELSAPDFSLADLLAPGRCPELLRAAARVPMGRAPLEGSVRVLEGGEVRARFARIAPAGGLLWLRVPERIRVVRAGERAACADLQPQIAPSAPWAQSLECGAEGRIRRAAPLQLGKPVWDRALERWAMVARCARPADCVPFLVELSGPAPPVPMSQTPSGSASAELSSASGSRMNSGKLVMRPGQAATLLWDQDGIRFTGRATCLDAGHAGELVRARIVPGGRVVRAVVVSSAMLRAVS